jgi:Flp pilus assembly protein TadG
VISGWLVKIVVALAIVGFLVVELGSPLLTKATLDGTAHDAADDAAHEYFQDHDPDKAQQTAVEDAENGHAHLERFSIDDQGVVHVTLSKQARSYVLHRFKQTKDWYNVRVSVSAVPK